MNMLIENKVYYKIFDLSFKQSSHIYSKKNKFDDPMHQQIIEENRKSVIDYYQAENMVILQQVHGNKIIDADLISDHTIDIEADGAVTTKENLILTVQTADCTPILLTSKNGEVIGSGHCGWRGSKAGIVSNLVKLMYHKGAKDIKAVICPTIQQYSYEVDQKYYDDFVNQQSDWSKFFIESNKKGCYMFDLPAYVELNLQEAGVKHIINVSEDTYTNPDKYPSYRRSCHTGELYNRTILSTISILTKS
jgi:YfiH family protein